MISYITLKNILTNSNIYSDPIRKPWKLFNFSDNLQTFLKNINKLDIPNESFICSLYYLINCIKNDKTILTNILNNTKLFIFTGIILYNKFNIDYSYDIKYLCDYSNINYNQYLEIERLLLKTLNYKLYIDTNDIENFKKYLEHYTDLHHIQD